MDGPTHGLSSPATGPASARPAHRTAVIVATGDELILGQRQDTNSPALARELLALGVKTVTFETVGDDRVRLFDVLSRRARECDLILITGGLGPTDDDLTREALGDVLGERDLIRDPDAERWIDAWFAARGRTVTPGARRMALRPRSARALNNTVGSAPGLAAVVGRADVICLPGPPAEMRDVFDRHVRPMIRPDAGETIATRILPTIGLGESEVARRLGDLMARDRNPLIGTTASNAIVTCRIRFEGPASEADASLDHAERAVRAALGPCILGVGERPIAAFIIDLLREKRETIAVAESCTGGLLGGAISGIPGASDVFSGGWITYTNEMKMRQLRVPDELLATHGAVSGPCARAMADGARRASDASYAVSITGIAGPDGGTARKPVGEVWVAVATPDGQTHARRFLFTGDRQAIREWSVNSALAAVRLAVIGNDMILLREVPPDVQAVEGDA